MPLNQSSTSRSPGAWSGATLFLACALLASGTHAQETFFVDPSGDDDNPGTELAPLATFAGAVERVRGVLDGDGAIDVVFRDGTYLFTETVVLGPADSGSPGQRITYRADKGATPVFTSLVPVTGWSPFRGPIQHAPLPAGIDHVRFLHDAGEDWLPRSATAPFAATETSFCVECTWDDPAVQANKSDIRYPAGFAAPDWSHAGQYDLRQSQHAWTQEILPIASVNAVERRIFTEIPALYEMRRDTSEDDIPNRNWVLNSLEGIDQPGEWASLDGTLYHWPLAGTGDLSVPRLVELIRVDEGTVDGNADFAAPIENIHFDGITFTGGDFYVMQPGDVTTQHDWSVVDEGTALLRFRNARNCSVRRSTFEKSGSTGLRLDRYAQNIVIAGNIFRQLGREAIVLTGRAPGRGDVNKNHRIEANHISATGREKWTAPALMIDQSSSNRVASNYIADTDFTAIVLTAPRQLAMLSHGETEGAGVSTVREFHYQEIPQAVTDFILAFDDLGAGSREAMQFVYNHGNRIEGNALIDVCRGRGYLVNGYVYVSGFQRHASNFLERNYVYDSGDNLQNNMAFYSDSDQDNCDYIGNMIRGLDVGDAPAPFPLLVTYAQWAESDPDTPSGRILLRANAVSRSTFDPLLDGQFIQQEGTLIDGAGGSFAFASIYRNMFRTLCPRPMVPGSPWPEAAEMRAELADALVRLGSDAPQCAEEIFADFFESGEPEAGVP
ncbi:MAG: right-handed parallel beta-helix repeat-containing protein [Acidobacteriota bacterium]